MEYFGPFFPPGYFSGGYWGGTEEGGGPVYADAAATITASATVTATLEAVGAAFADMAATIQAGGAVSATLEIVSANSIAGGRRKRIRVFDLAEKRVELEPDDDLIEVAERVEKALKLYRPVQKSDVQKLARLPGVKAAVERAIRERDDEEAALMMLVA
jgi:hypothetical protein